MIDPKSVPAAAPGSTTGRLPGARSFYILAYDIADDKRRARIAKLMESLGERVQGSVFEAYLTPAEMEKLTARSKKVMDSKEDSLRVYRLCEECRAKIAAHGAGKITQPPGVMIV